MIKFFRNKVAVLASAVMLAGIGGVYLSGTNLVDAQARLDLSTRMQMADEKLLIALLDAETGQRGYILTGNDTYLEPYARAAVIVSASFAGYDRMRLNPDQQAFVETIRPLVTEKLAELDQTVRTRRTHGYDSAMKIVLTNQGKDLMDILRNHFTIQRERAYTYRESMATRVSICTQSTLYSIFVMLIGLLMLWGSFVRN